MALLRSISVVRLFHAVLLFCGAALLSGLAFPFFAQAYSVEYFQTDEYYRMGSLAQINAAQAYALGFTGQGVTVAVIDDGARPSHQEFRAKSAYPVEYFIIPDEQAHGTHVAGTVAGLKNDLGMHGVAFDANLVSLCSIDGTPLQGDDDDAIRASIASLARYPDVRIVNNSWGPAGLICSLSSYANWPDDVKANEHEQAQVFADIVAKQDALFVVAAGNDGAPAPSIPAPAPSFLLGTELKAPFSAVQDIPAYDSELGERLKNNFISVSAYDPYAMATFGTTSPAFVYAPSCMADGASEYSIMAPGAGIYSATDVGDSSYDSDDGTSMAAPHVSGAAALVSQAFPYMGGKQLADVILSTATPLTSVTAPHFFVLIQDDGANTVTAYTADASINSSALVGKDEELKRIWRVAYKRDPSVNELEFFRNQLTNLLDNHMDDNMYVMPMGDYLSLFGTGLLDAGKAVRGPGYLGANRLNPVSDLSSGNEFGDGRSYAMYAVNSKGYDSIWSNDIGQRANDEMGNSLFGLDVGLRKQGDGVLYLTGNNSYAGPTSVEGGGLSLGMNRPGPSLSGSLAGNVFVRQSAFFTGSGTVFGDLVSEGGLLPGHYSLPGTGLSVGGRLHNSGELFFTLGRDGAANRLAVTGDVDLSASTAIEIIGSGNEPIEPFQDFGVVLSSAGTITYPAGMPDRIDFSAFLSFLVERTDKTMAFRGQTRRLDSLPGVPGQTQAVASALQYLYDRLEGSPLQDQLDFLYGTDRGGFLNAAEAYRGDIQAATLARLPFTDVLNRLVTANPLGQSAGPRPPARTPEEFSPQLGEPGPCFWLRPVLAYSRVNEKGGIGQEATGTHMRGLVIGAQRDWAEDFYGGVLLAFGDSDVSQGSGRAEIIDLRGGFYGGWTPGGFSLGVAATGGWQHYRVRRDIPVEQGRDTLSSRFDGMSLGFGVEASYNLLYDVADVVALSPYAGYDFDYIRQQGRTESGNDVFALSVDGDDVWRSTLRAGLSAELSPLDWFSLSASAGYKRLLSGHKQGLDVGFKADSSYRFTAVGPDEGRDFITYDFGMEAALPRNVTLSAKFFGENSDRSHSYGGFANVAVAF